MIHTDAELLRESFQRVTEILKDHPAELERIWLSYAESIRVAEEAEAAKQRLIWEKSAALRARGCW